MRLPHFLPKTGLALALIILVGLLAFFAPLGRESRWLYRFTNGTEPTLVQLNPGDEAVQTLTTPAARISGIQFFVDSESPFDRPQVRLTDDQGHVVAYAHGYSYSYFEGHLAVSALLPWQKLPNKGHLNLVISHKSKTPIQLLTVNNPRYAHETLTVGNQVQAGQTLPLELIEPTKVSTGFKQGLAAGSFLLLAAVLGLELLVGRPKWQWRWLMVSVGLTTPLLLAGFWFSQQPLGINDWDYYFSLHTIWRGLVLNWHQFPMWNPYTCGGTAALGDPEFSMFTPTFMLELLFGVPTGVRLAIYVSTAVGAIGMLAWAKRFGLSPWGGLMASIVAFFGTVNLLEIVEGHVNIFAAMWIPWVFWAWLGAYRAPRLLSRPLLWCSLFLALTFYQGGIYLLFYTLITFILLPFLVRRPWQAIRVTVVSGVLALGLAALKLLPVILWLHQFPDQAYASAPYSMGSTIDILFGRYLHGATVVPDQVAGWHEYGAYIGYFAFALALIGLSYIRKKPGVRVLLITAVFFWLVSTAGPLLAPLFDRAPYLPRSMITRIILYSILPLSLLAGLGMDKIRQRWSHGPLIAVVVLALVIFDIFSLTYQLSDQAFIVPMTSPRLPPLQEPISFVRKVHYTPVMSGEQYISQYPVSLLGYGTLNYCSVLGPGGHITAIEDDRPQGYVQTDPLANTKVVSWSPNKVVVSVEAAEPTLVVLNTNFAEGWRVNQKRAEELEGRVFTAVPPGQRTLTFHYHTPGLANGAITTAITLLGVIYLFIITTRDRAKKPHTVMTTGNEKVAG